MGHHIAQHFDIYDMAEVKADFKAGMSQFMFILFSIRSNLGMKLGFSHSGHIREIHAPRFRPSRQLLRLLD